VGIGFGTLAEGVSRIEQVGYQFVGIGATWAWSFVMTSAILLAIKFAIGLRVHDHEEVAGLDISQHGEPAYVTEEPGSLVTPAPAMSGGDGGD
jgi:ammonia channel protein AmtB